MEPTKANHQPVEHGVRRAALVLTILITGGCLIGLTGPAVALPPCRSSDPPPDCPDPKPPPPRPPAPPPVPGDGDGDRMVDTYEDELLARFAPKVWLHTAEDQRPVNVNWLLARATLRYSHTQCSDDEILRVGDVTVANLTEQRHKNKHDAVTWPPWDACDHYGDYQLSNYHTGRGKDTFFLEYPGDTHHGASNPRDWEIYGHVYSVASGIVVQYWQLYSWNDSVATINHEGDWEFTAVLLDQAEKPTRVAYSRHGKVRVYLPQDVSWEGDHLVTYAANGSHAQYPDTRVGDVCGLHTGDVPSGVADRCNRGTAWDTWAAARPIVNVGERGRPRSGSNWIRYSGLWGEIGESATTSGPRGPAYQSSGWNWKG
jgi:hypothetical protein